MDKLYTIIEVANKLNISDKTLRRWEDAGKFASSRTLGNQRRYSLEDLQILDAIKHGTINEQKDLLNVDQAGKLCGVSPTTIVRWENDGKIHPMITSGNTYYIRQRLMEKIDELKKIYVEPELEIVPASKGSYTPGVKGAHTPGVLEDPVPVVEKGVLPTNNVKPKLSQFNIQSSIFNALITIALILSYHLIFNSTALRPISPQTGSVQGVSTMSDPIIDLLKTILDPSGALTTTTLTSRVGLISPTLSLSPSSAPMTPSPGTVYYDASTQSLKIFKGTGWFDLAPSTTLKVGDVALFTNSGTLPKGQNQVSFTDPSITLTTPITITFTSDYAPAKKYWVTTDQGSFTVHTDFAVGADSAFNYSFLTPIISDPIIKNPQVE